MKAKLSDLQKDLEAWRAKQLKVRSKDRGDAPLNLPNLQWPIIAVDSTGMNDTVDAALARIQELNTDEKLARPSARASRGVRASARRGARRRRRRACAATRSPRSARPRPTPTSANER